MMRFGDAGVADMRSSVDMWAMRWGWLADAVRRVLPGNAEEVWVRRSDVWSWGRGWKSWWSGSCFWCQVGLSCIRELTGCGSLETVGIYIHVSNEGAWRI